MFPLPSQLQTSQVNAPAISSSSAIPAAINTPAQPPPVDPEYAELFTFSTIKPRLDKQISSWNPVITNAKTNREHRYKDLDIKQLRANKVIRENEFMIPVRSIDQNIRREQPAYINFFKQSKRLAIFKDLYDPQAITSRLEEEYSRGLTYSGWETPMFKVIDGAQTHGWDWCEVTFDETKPLHVAIEHIGHDKLIFPLDAHDIQACQMIFRVYSVSPRQLKNFVTKFKFNETEVNRILEKQKDAKLVEHNVTIYKKFCKYNNVVYVSWFSCDCEDWLLAPQPHYVGRQQLVSEVVKTPIVIQTMAGPIASEQEQMQETWQPLTERMYPVFRLPYYETEQAKLTDVVGRVFLDKHKQEAKTANISQFINASQNASEVLCSVDTDTIRNEAELQNITLTDDAIIPVKVKFFSPPPPDASMLSLQNYLDSFDSQEAGRMDFAALNRKDSRKTATEVSAAREESAILGSVQVSLFSRFLRELYSYAWEIVKSQAMQFKITFLSPDGEPTNNDLPSINRIYEIRAAGDIDVVRRLETIAQYKEFWPVVQNTHIAIPFLARLLRLALPEDGAYFAEQLEKADPRAILTQLVAILEATLTPQELAGLTPEQQQTLMQVMLQAKQIAETYTAEAMGGGTGGDNNPKPSESNKTNQPQLNNNAQQQ